MSPKKSYHSLCRWTFNAGKGGFVPDDIRPAWDQAKLDTLGVIRLIKEKIAPRVPEHIVLGFEIHYDNEVNEQNAEAVVETLLDCGMYLAMITPGAHIHYGYGGPASLDIEERKSANFFARRTVDLAYQELRKAWHPDKSLFPSLVIWNGSFGYDLATTGVQQMYQNLKDGIAGICQYEAQKGGDLYIGIEPKPNEGHAAMLLPTVASAIIFWHKLEKEYGILTRSGVHCAPLAHKTIGTHGDGGTTRLSFGPFLSREDVKYACEAIGQICERQVTVGSG